MRAGAAVGWIVVAGALTIAGACRSAPVPVAPIPVPVTADLEPSAVAAAAEWSARFRMRSTRYDLEWVYQTPDGKVGGRAVAQFVPPDSLLFEYRAPFRRNGAIAIIGDRVAWSRPRDAVGRLVPAVRLFWLAMGLPSPPGADATISAKSTAASEVWRLAWSDTVLTYAQWSAPRRSLTAGLERNGRLVGTAFVALRDSSLLPVSGHVVLDDGRTFVNFTMGSITVLGPVDPSIWREPDKE